MVCPATSERFSCHSLLTSATLFLYRRQASFMPGPLHLLYPLPGRLSQIPLCMVLVSLSSPGIRGPRKEDEPFLSLTLKAQIFPVIAVEGTVKLGAGQLLIDGLEDSAMCWVSAIQATCPKTHPCFRWIALQGKTKCFSR